MHRPPPANRLPFSPTARPSRGHVTRERRAPAAALIGRRRERGAGGGGEDGPGALAGLQPQGCEVELGGRSARPAGQHLPTAPDCAAGQR